MLRHKKRIYLKAVGLAEPKPVYKEKAEKAIKVTKKAIHNAGWKFLKLFEDTSPPKH